eukprot:Clim_evm11s208 gene=Clim_evmTU11s208
MKSYPVWTVVLEGLTLASLTYAAPPALDCGYGDVQSSYPTLYKGGQKNESPKYGGTSIRDLRDYRNWEINYGDWVDPSTYEPWKQFDLVVLTWSFFTGTEEQMQRSLEDLQAGVDGKRGTSDDVAVIVYLSVYEEETKQDKMSPKALEGKLYAGDGRGPVTFEDGETKYLNQGIADWYMSTAGNCTLDVNPWWGAYYVDARSKDWQDVVMDEARHWIKGLGFDGIFFDTVDDADPWTGKGFTAEGASELVLAFKNEFPDSLLAWNRGLYWFAPHFSYHYSFNPIKHLDFVLFESYYQDGNYEVNPWLADNRNFWLGKLLAEAARSDSYTVLLELSYWEDLDNAPNTPSWPGYLSEITTFGFLPYIADKHLQKSSNVAAQSIGEDVSAPEWFSSANGFVSECNAAALYFDYKGDGDDTDPGFGSRTGAQVAYSDHSGIATVEFDLPVDQTRPLRFNAYVTKSGNAMDYDAKVVKAHAATTYKVNPGEANKVTKGESLRLADIGTTIGRHYEGVGYHCGGREWHTDTHVYPFQFNLEGLEPGTYDITIRAEDSTIGVKYPQTGRTGPSDGIEEENEVIVTVTV